MFHDVRQRAARAACVAAALACTAFAVTGCGSSDDGPQLNGATRTPPSKVGALRLPDAHQAGSPETPMRPDKGLLLVYFGYTSCPDVCPTTMADLGAAMKQLTPSERAKVQIGMVTVDPKRDTGKVLSSYVSHFFPGTTVHAYRTETPAQLARAERTFGASHELGTPDSEGNYDVTHTAQVYAVDRTGTVRVEWPFGTKPEPIAQDLRTLLQRS